MFIGNEEEKGKHFLKLHRKTLTSVEETIAIEKHSVAAAITDSVTITYEC